MTGSVPPGRPDQSRIARRFAALSGHFDPQEALGVVQDLDENDTEAVVALATDLAAACDTQAGRARGTWLMRGPERRWELESLSDEGLLVEMVEWRRRAGQLAGETRDLLDALVGADGFDFASLRGLVTDGSSRRRIERAAVALDRAGRLAPAEGLLGTLRAALTRQDNRARGAGLLADGFVGRVAELSEIAAWLESPVTAGPVTALFVSGLPGIGKSTLLEEAVRRATELPWVVVRLDFDRAGLDVRDWIGLTVELARQVAAEIGEQANDLRETRLEAAAATVTNAPSVKGESREQLPVALVGRLADHLHRARRPLLLMLDTLEVLRGRGATHPARLFTWLDQLAGAGLTPLSVLAAGRGDALDSVPVRVPAKAPLDRLDPASVDVLMTRLGVAPSSADAVRDIADGNPLVLRLAAAVAQDAGAAELRKLVKRRELAAAYLYRFLLSRIDQPTLKDLAFPGLVVRRIDPEVIADVLGPQLGHRRIEPAQAVALFEELSRQHWLVQPDPQAPGFVTHRTEVRQVLLRLLYESSPAKCARIDRAAADWFARRQEPWSQVESAYHRLQLMRRDPAIPLLDPAVLRRFDEKTISELPEAARDVVRRVRGERSSLARSDGTADVDLDAATREFEAIVGRGDWLEGRLFYQQVFRDAVFDARSRTADVVRAFLWRCGDWHEAKRLLDERDRLDREDHDLAQLPPVLAAPRMEMRAELSARQLVRSIAADPTLAGLAASSSGHGLRSELNDGALGFVLHRAGGQRPISTARGYDGVGAVIAIRDPDREPGAGASEFGVAAGRLGRRVREQMPVPRPDDGSAAGPLGARFLAVLMPYADVAVTLSRVRNNPAVGRHAEAVDRRLAVLGGLPPQGVGPWTVLPAYAEAIHGLAALGLLAEWSGAAAFVLRHPDLALIARSAERWRRTAAGLWSYGFVPMTWREWLRPLDVTMADRVDQLQSAADPVADSRSQLAVWSSSDAGDGDPTALLADIRRRLTGSLDQARASTRDDATATARVLLRRYVPSAFVPALAVLIAHRQF